MRIWRSIIKGLGYIVCVTKIVYLYTVAYVNTICFITFLVCSKGCGDSGGGKTDTLSSCLNAHYISQEVLLIPPIQIQERKDICVLNEGPQHLLLSPGITGRNQ